MTVVIGTAGHIDHGKTALLRALTGIDADRLPEERRRGMTIDVGYAHLGLPDGSELDFVDVPGHDKLVGNMLVGAGEIDAVLLVVAADDGPRAQTLEHLDLLDALGLRHGIAVVTKVDLVDSRRVREVREEVSNLLVSTSLAGSPVFAASSETRLGIESLVAELVGLGNRVEASTGTVPRHARLAIDRIFTVKGRGTVVTGTLRGGMVRRNMTLLVVPGDAAVRARELQVHGRAVEAAGPGRTAINVAGIDADALHRGMVLTNDPDVVATDRVLVRLDRPVADRTRIRVHLGTAAVDAAVGRAGRDAIDLPDGSVAGILRLASPLAAAPGDRFVLRDPTMGERAVGGTVLDPEPARGISRRRQTPERVLRLAESVAAAIAVAGSDAAGADAPLATARLDLHGAIRTPDGRTQLADDVAELGIHEILAAAGVHETGSERASGLADARARAARVLRRAVTLRREGAASAAGELVDCLVEDGRLIRQGERLWLPGSAVDLPRVRDPGLIEAMDRLERALDVPAPPPLNEAAHLAGCPPDGVRELERSGRIVVIEDDLGYGSSTYRTLENMALDMAGRAPLTPASLRDATGTSRKYVMAILTDLDRRGILRRTDAGHVPGARAPTMSVTGRASSDRP